MLEIPQHLNKPYLKRLLVSYDQHWNVKFSPLLNWYYSTVLFGDEDECISSVLGKMALYGRDTRFRKFVDYVFLKVFGQENHCFNNIGLR